MPRHSFMENLFSKFSSAHTSVPKGILGIPIQEVHIQLAASQRQLKGRLSLVLLADLVQLLSRV